MFSVAAKPSWFHADFLSQPGIRNSHAKGKCRVFNEVVRRAPSIWKFSSNEFAEYSVSGFSQGLCLLLGNDLPSSTTAGGAYFAVGGGLRHSSCREAQAPQSWTEGALEKSTAGYPMSEGLQPVSEVRIYTIS